MNLGPSVKTLFFFKMFNFIHSDTQIRKKNVELLNLPLNFKNRYYFDFNFKSAQIFYYLIYDC